MSWYVAHSLDQLLAEINVYAPDRNKASDGSIGDANHSSGTSDHNPCDCHDAVCARDFTHDPGGGFDSYAFAHWLAERTQGPEARVKYIISNGKIASGQGQSYPAGVWRNYTGSNPHDHHVHVSVRHGSELFNNAGSWNWSSGATPGPTPEPPKIGKDQMFALIRFDGKVYRWNGINRVFVSNEQMLGGDQIMLGVLGMDNKVYDVDPWWGSTFPEVTTNEIYWNSSLIAQNTPGVDPATIA